MAGTGKSRRMPARAPRALAPVALALGLLLAAAAPSTAQSRSRDRDEKGRTPEAIAEEHRSDRERAARERESAERAFEDFLATASLDAPSSECAILDERARECLATTGDFNSGLRDMPFPEGLDTLAPAERARLGRQVRRGLLDSRLRLAYRRALVAESGEAGDLRDGFVRDLEAAVARDTARHRRLQALFRTHREEIFLHLPEARVEVLASTDSTLLASIRADWDAGSGRGPGARPAWRPATLPLSQAPREFQRHALGLSPGIWSPPVRVGFGYALLRIPPGGPGPKLPFAACLPYLLALESLPPRPAADGEALLREAYASRPGGFPRPDTLQVEARLSPRAASARGDSTAAPVRPLVLEGESLPPPIRRIFREHREWRAGDTLRNVASEFGSWSLRVLAWKPGVGTLGFAEARTMLAEEAGRLERDRRAEALRSLVSAKLRDRVEAGILARRAGGADPASASPGGEAEYRAWVRDRIRLSRALSRDDVSPE